MKARLSTGSAIPLLVGDLAGLDALEHESLCLFVASDSRPLRGVAGYVDWRANGALSRALIANTFSGRADEVLLFPVRGRLGEKRLFLFGLGPKGGCTAERLTAACRRAIDVARRAGAATVALAVPTIANAPDLERAFMTAAERIGPKDIDAVLVPP